MNFEKDEIGLPKHPQIREMILSLGYWALEYWGECGNSTRQAEIAHRYQAIIAELYALGWDDEIHVHSQISEEYMPEEYKKRNPELFE